MLFSSGWGVPERPNEPRDQPGTIVAQTDRLSWQLSANTALPGTYRYGAKAILSFPCKDRAGGELRPEGADETAEPAPEPCTGLEWRPPFCLPKDLMELRQQEQLFSRQ